MLTATTDDVATQSAHETAKSGSVVPKARETIAPAPSPSPDEAHSKQAAENSRQRLPFRARHILIAAVAAAIIGGGIYAGWKYWTEWRFEVSTDDAYVQADVVAIAPQVSGDISALYVDDNQHVKAGQVLAVIDQRDYKAAVDQAKAGVKQAEAVIATDQAQIVEQQAVVSEAEATIKADEATEKYAEQNDKRFGTLANEGYGSVQAEQQAASQIGTAQATLAKDKAALTAAQKQIVTLTAELRQARAMLSQNNATLEQAEINLGYTTITSPVDGIIGDRTVRVGQYAQPGTELLAVVPLKKAYVVANFKETELAEVRPGQPVTIAVDTFDDETVQGYVGSIAPASGQEFALLPPDNATGNFTKIVQRIPVKIYIDPNDPFAGKLRPGMSVIATIDTHRKTPASAPVAKQAP
ncbi:MAG: HlyD family secretion protein [Proteobacteria bacterium]|nr:HlyD family secretion protein [Pseudomonadota bacterium]